MLLRRLAPERAAQVTFTVEAARAIFRYDWPLNIRELEKCLGTAVVLAGHGPIDLEHLPAPVRDALTAPAGQKTVPELSPEDQKRREEIVALLQENGGNISAVARQMGKARMQIQRWIKRYNIDPASFRS